MGKSDKVQKALAMKYPDPPAEYRDDDYTGLMYSAALIAAIDSVADSADSASSPGSSGSDFD